MKTFIFAVCAFVGICMFASCGSQWEVSGNNITITKVDKDTVVKQGTYIITDSLMDE